LSEEQAVLRLQRGDQSALTPLYNQYAESALRTAFLITRSRAAAEDAVQDAFVQVIRNIGALRSPAAFRPWFYRIVINTAKRSARNSGRSISLEVGPLNQADLTALSPEEAALSLEQIQAVRVAIAQLNDMHREIITLKYYTQLSEEEIAGALSIPPGTVKSRLFRAREALQQLLATREGVIHS